MIIEKEKILRKPRNAGTVSEGLVYIGMYVHFVKIMIFNGIEKWSKMLIFLLQKI